MPESTDSGTDAADSEIDSVINDDIFSSGLLEQVPEEHRDLFKPYIEKWDGAVSSHLKGVAEKYEPYTGLDLDAETLQQASELYQLLANDPEKVYKALADEFGPKEEVTEKAPTSEKPDPFDSLDPAIKEKLKYIDRHEQTLELLAEYVLGQNQATQEQQEDAELDSHLSELKKAHGEFDEDFVLAKMQAGMDGAQAVKSWNTLVQKYVNAESDSSSSVPPILSSMGGNGAGDKGRGVNDLDSKEIKELVGQMLRG